jgi:dolichyl-phosphate beta-glucosyltransferase
VESFAFDIELLYLARSWALRIDRLPIEMTNAPGSTIHLFRDSLRMLHDIWSIRQKALRGEYPPRPEEL